MAALEDLGRTEENNVPSQETKYCFRSLQESIDNSDVYLHHINNKNVLDFKPSHFIIVHDPLAYNLGPSETAVGDEA
ncbi:hypothetical protein J6590_096145 [Homalodisca vitripennis]|nr:hypothetical protein J6590_096145 [Homalodisca vitripennis]